MERYLYSKIIEHNGDCHPISIFDSIEKSPSNISVCNYKGYPLYIIRLTDYIIYPAYSSEDIIWYIQKNKARCHSNNLLYYPHEGICSILPDPSPSDYLLADRFSGYEDPRIIVYDDQIYTIGCRPDKVYNKAIPAIYTIDMSSENICFKDECLINTLNTSKNWVPVEDRPLIMKDINNRDLFEICNSDSVVECNFKGPLSGSSQIIRISEDRYLCIVHERQIYVDTYGYRHMRYYHRFVILDNDLKVVFISRLFHFLISGLEFCCGLCLIGDTVHITFSVNDSSVHEITISLKELMNIIDNDSYWCSSNPPKEYFKTSYTQLTGYDRLSYLSTLMYADDIPELYFDSVVDILKRLQENDFQSTITNRILQRISFRK